MIEALINRLSQRIPDLAGRVEGAGELAELMSRNALPQSTPAANVIPLGFNGRAEDAAAGLFVQNVEEAIGVVITLRNNTPAGRRALDRLRDFLMEVILAIAGWAPGDEVGVFRLVRGNLVSAKRGTIVYQLDFSISDQLRILT